MIYLLGIDHKIQHDGPLGAKSEHVKIFVEFLGYIIEDLSIETIAEEFNEEAKQWNHVTESVVERVASEKKLNFIFCEPDKRTRKENGILTEPEIYKKLGLNTLIDPTVEQQNLINSELEKQFSIREAFWYEKMEGNLDTNVLCIIGASHVPTFGALLKEKGHEYEVISQNWCLDNFA